MNNIELLVNVTPYETRAALVENGILRELTIERESKKGIVGNIYRGKILRVLPGMQSAFVDIGLEKAAFLHAVDIISPQIITSQSQNLTNNDPNDIFSQNNKKSVAANISTLVHVGQTITVQVIKEPIGTKGARLTTDITLASRNLVLMPKNTYIGISQKITDEQEKERLKMLLTPFANKKAGFIIRTAAEGISAKTLHQDVKYLLRQWEKICERKKDLANKSYLIYSEPPLALKILRDYVGNQITKVRVDSKLTFEALGVFCKDFLPQMLEKITLYTGEQPLFDIYQIDDAIQKALQKRINLKSGGYLILDQTEALTTIDVNTGAFVGNRNLEETIFNTNIEATQAIAHQLRLRNLGGIIIIDFIDMLSETNKERILTALHKELAKDRVKTNINGFTNLGLVEMTRKRTSESLEQILCHECKACNGNGQIKSIETVSYEILREIIRINRLFKSEDFLIYASANVADYLINEETNGLMADLSLFIGKQVKIKAEPSYTQTQFDVIVM